MLYVHPLKWKTVQHNTCVQSIVVNVIKQNTLLYIRLHFKTSWNVFFRINCCRHKINSVVRKIQILFMRTIRHGYEIFLKTKTKRKLKHSNKICVLAAVLSFSVAWWRVYLCFSLSLFNSCFLCATSVSLYMYQIGLRRQ